MRYDLALSMGAKEVAGIFISGKVHDPQNIVSAEKNTLTPPATKFNKDYVPEAPEYKKAGFRPVAKTISPP
jgi:hypothetical protein